MAQVAAQANDGTERQHVPQGKASYHLPHLYLTASTGLNNNTGFTGTDAEYCIMPYFSVQAGFGLGTWGNKYFGGLKYYTRARHLGWAFGLGMSHNTGQSNFTTSLSTINNDQEQVTLNLYSQTNLVLAAYKYWRLGRNNNRFYLELGYALPFKTGDDFTQTAGTPIDNSGAKIMRLISPGGVIAGVGFSFGII